jgi:class 3 adenylate cyclase
MADPEMERRTRRFRFGSYAAYTLIATALAWGAEPAVPMLVLACVLLPLASAITALAARRGGVGQWVENLVTPFVLAATGLPLLPCLAANAAMLLGTLALRGFRAALPALVVIGFGWLAGRHVAPEIAFALPLAGELLAWLFLVGFSAPLAAYGYEEAMRQHRGRQAQRARSDSLERDRDTLVRYLPDDLPQRLREGATAPARRWLTVAAIDLEAFTAHLERLAPEDLVTVLDDVYGLFADLAADYGGVLHKFLGDGALVCFGATGDRGRRAEAAQCVAMVRDLPRRMMEANDGWRARGVPARFVARAGVASGYCTLGALGHGSRFDFTLVGLPVNLASRLQALAPGGGARVDGATAALLGDALGSGAPVDVKGFDRPVVVHEA